MATSMAQVPLPNCEICEQNIGRRYCIDCEQYFCKTCEEFHLKSKSCKDHVFQNLGQINPEEKKVKCKEHEENMTYYCTTCSMLVCKICLPDKHTKHDFTLSSEAASKFKSDLIEKIYTMKTVVGSIAQQRAKLEEKSNQFLIRTQNLVQEINKKGTELKNVVDKIVCDKVSNVTKKQQKILQKKTKEERILKDAEERGQLVILKVANAVENQGDTMLLNSHQALLQAIQSMPDMVKSDMDFTALSFKDGYLSEITLTRMLGRVKISKKDEPVMVKRNMLKVTRLPPTTTQDSLQYFFEDTRKFGGGDVEDVEYDEDTASAYITFEEDEAVKIVLKKIPILFNEKTIEVSAHTVNEDESLDIIEEYESNSSTSEPSPTCTIEVRRMTDRTTQDTIMYYFESKKGANADVKTIEYIEDTDMYLITFQDEVAVERVLQKSHTVDGNNLQVKKHIPPKRYPNKALVKSFNPKTTEDDIINFLEARTTFLVEDIDFGEEDTGNAIVTFYDPIDCRPNLENTCPYHFTRIGESCYFFGRHGRTMEEASKECLGLCSRLAIISSRNENLMITQLLNQHQQPHKANHYWIDAYRNSSSFSGPWQWMSTGTLLGKHVYSHWRPGSHSHTKPDGEHCASMGKGESSDPENGYFWDHRSCKLHSPALCEYPLGHKP
ncbi:Hypothetical predicted protein [Mytilus galloprovincialis]|uniref:Uncharacterized protein n=1 Tax=Mytilus galloprovincialis TaxID=29158 RepID=A0A8B6EEX6_MYTGA|nr:Hypothetical predicted protein [Mytilus galloprovincialis]